MKLKLASLAIAILFTLGTASATVVGNLGVGSAAGVNATITSLTFLPDPSATPPGPPWDGEVNNQTNLMFNGGPLNVTEGVEINQNTPFVAGSTTLPEDYFFRFAAHPLLDFELTGVSPSTAFNTSGNPSDCAAVDASGVGSCSLNIAGTLSPVVLAISGTTSTIASIHFVGMASDTGSIGAGASAWSGSFSPTITQSNCGIAGNSVCTPDQIALYFCPDYNTANMCTAADVAAFGSKVLAITSNSGSFQVTATPEPGTMASIFIGAGLIALGTRTRRRRRQNV